MKYYCTIHNVEYRSGDSTSCPCAVDSVINPSHVIQWDNYTEQNNHIDLAEQFWREQSIWSQRVFGTDEERGPRGPLLHLEKEIQEALIAGANYGNCNLDNERELFDKFQMELVDCFFLVIDAARRSGLTYKSFMKLAFKKLEINKARKWQKPTSDMPVEHDRSEE